MKLFIFKSRRPYINLHLGNFPMSSVVNGQAITSFGSTTVEFGGSGMAAHTFVTENSDLAAQIRRHPWNNQLFWEVPDVEETPVIGKKAAKKEVAPEDLPEESEVSSGPVAASLPSEPVDGITNKNEAISFLRQKGYPADELKKLGSVEAVKNYGLNKGYNFPDWV